MRFVMNVTLPVDTFNKALRDVGHTINRWEKAAIHIEKVMDADVTDVADGIGCNAARAAGFVIARADDALCLETNAHFEQAYAYLDAAEEHLDNGWLLEAVQSFRRAAHSAYNAHKQAPDPATCP